MTFVFMEHPESGGTARFPDDDTVITSQEARGWRRADEPPEGPFIPAKADVPPGDDGAWVDLIHPDLPLGRQRLPNNPEALAGAFDVGWRYPDPPAEQVAEHVKTVRGGKGGRATKEQRRQAEDQAAAAAAVTDEPPDIPTGEPTTAGDGTSEAKE